MDYETLSLSLPVLVGLGQGWSIGGQLKFVRLWGGFMDPLIETFHGWFNFPNNAREQLPDNRVCIDLDTANGYSYHLNEARWLAADPVFVLGYSPWQAADGALQLIGQLSLPLSRGAGITGSPLPVLGLGLYGDWWPANWLGIHSAAGVILPAEALQARGPLPMYQARLALIGNFGGDVLPFVEFTFQSSPIQSGLMDAAGDYFARPNSDLYFGIVIAGPDARKAGNFGAVTIQEDPFTHNSADVSFQGTGAFSIKP
jgi:hypothetical protein